MDELTAQENVEFPALLAGCPPRRGPTTRRATPRPGRARGPGRAPAHRRCPAGSASASRSPARWPTNRRSCSPTSRPATWTAPPPWRCCGCSSPCTAAGLTLVIATHDERIAATADRLISMRDGAFVDQTRLTGGTARQPRRPRRAGRLIAMGKLLLVYRLALKDLRHRAAQAILLLLAIAAGAATLTLGLALHGTTDNPYARTRAATNGPDVVAHRHHRRRESRRPRHRRQPGRTRWQRPGRPGRPRTPGERRRCGGAQRTVPGHLDGAPQRAHHRKRRGRRPRLHALTRRSTQAAARQLDPPRRRGRRGRVRRAPSASTSATGSPSAASPSTWSASRSPPPSRPTRTPAPPKAASWPTQVADHNPGLIWATQADTTQIARHRRTRRVLPEPETRRPRDRSDAFAARYNTDTSPTAPYLLSWQQIRDGDAQTLARVRQVLLARQLAARAAGARQRGRAGRRSDGRADPPRGPGQGGRRHTVAGRRRAAVEHVLVALVRRRPGAGRRMAGRAADRQSGRRPARRRGRTLADRRHGRAPWSPSRWPWRSWRRSCPRSAPHVRAPSPHSTTRPARPRRRASAIRLTAHLPAPLLLGARLAVRRPRRLLLNALSIAVTTSGLVTVHDLPRDRGQPGSPTPA